MKVSVMDAIAHHNKMIEETDCPKAIKVTRDRLLELREYHATGHGHKTMIDALIIKIEDFELKGKILDARISRDDEKIKAQLRDQSGWLEQTRTAH